MKRTPKRLNNHTNMHHEDSTCCDNVLTMSAWWIFCREATALEGSPEASAFLLSRAFPGLFCGPFLCHVWISYGSYGSYGRVPVRLWVAVCRWSRLVQICSCLGEFWFHAQVLLKTQSRVSMPLKNHDKNYESQVTVSKTFHTGLSWFYYAQNDYKM